MGVKQKDGLPLELRALITDELNLVAQVYLPGAAAGDATENWPAFYAAQEVQVVGAYYVPQAAITGQDTNTFHLNLINRGTDGTGTTEVGSIDFVAGTDAAAFDAVSFGVTAFSLAAGSVLAVQRELVGTGMAMPEGMVVIVYRFV